MENTFTFKAQLYSYRHYPDALKKIIENHSSLLNLEDSLGNTVLSFLVQQRDQRGFGCLIQSALENGADILRRLNKEENESIAACLISSQDPGYIRAIIQHMQKEGKHLDHAKNTILHLVCGSGATDFVEEAAKMVKNVDVRNESARTPLHLASLRGFPEIVQILLNQGADIDARDFDGDSPLHLAACSTRYKTEVMEMLLEHGANPNARNLYGKTPLHSLAESKENTWGPYESLIHSGADINLADEDKTTPLHIMCLKKAPQNISFMLANDVNLNAKNNRGYNALYFSILGDSDLATEQLLENGVEMKHLYLAYIQSSMEETMTKVLINHISLRKSQKPTWEPRDVKDFLEDVMSQEKYKNYRGKVNLEINSMKNTYVEDTCLTLWDIAISNVSKISKYSAIEKVLKFLRLEGYSTFPIFGDSLIRKCALAAKRRYMFQQTLECLPVLINQDLPLLCQEMIVENFDQQSLSKVINIYETITRKM